jgi:hypothetical protein
MKVEMAQPAPPPPGTVKEVDKPKPELIGLGLLLVLLAIAGVVYARAVGSVTVETTTPAPATNGVQQQPQAAASTKETKTKGAPSDNLLLAVVGVGGVLVLVGFLYGRISSITLPGGSKIDLKGEEIRKLQDGLKDKEGVDETAALPAAIADAASLKSALEVSTLSQPAIDLVVDSAAGREFDLSGS